MNTIIGEMGKSPKFIELLNKIESKQSPILISGLVGVGEAQIAEAIHKFGKKSILILTYNEIQAKQLYEDLSYYNEDVVFFPKKEIVTYDYIAESKDLPYERIEALNKIVSKKKQIVITTIEAAIQKLPAKKSLYKNELKIKVGESYNLEEIKKKLVNLGYSRYDLIEGRGQFSVRGGIVDIAVNNKTGIRVEFWGDEVDSIREFSISSQRSISEQKQATIYPAHEYILEQETEIICKKIKESNKNIKQKDILEEDIEQIKQGNYISKIDKYFDSFYEKQETIIDYINDEYCIFLDEIGKIEQREINLAKDRENLEKALVEKEKIIPDTIINNLSFEQIDEKLEEKQLIYIEKQDTQSKIQAEKYKFNYREINYYKSEIEGLFSDLEKWQKEKKKIYILLETKEKANKLKKLLEEKEIVCKIELNLDKTIISGTTEIVKITIGKISTGFENYETNQIVIDANDLIDGKRKTKKIVHTAYKEGEKVVFADLKIGDYVVHKKYGVGIYIGVNTIKADGTIKDYIKIKYKNDDILYIPTNDLDTIRKYVGGDKAVPKINRLGSKEWENTKAKVKKNLREVATELIELYAKRDKIEGYSFSKDTPWQQEFEDKFSYQETEDQLRCIEEVKKDMEKPVPMDRLLCGDVGYGKTEVAIRAAFKAVMDQKQVAYLVPTTVLANQQYEEFKSRMEEFPIRVDLLNRFRTKKEQEQVIKKLKLGELDVVIGTHRLLSKDVEFKDLGLLIIDEEQRFGVKDKEKIKQLKNSVDVLTMTATPIPRTLHMSILGVRDMSVIYEPPQNRRPVQTYVLEYDEEIVREAILKEVERGGQVFYLFNNVEQIAKKANDVAKLVPEAKISYAHGKMTGKELEEIMEAFISKEIDVLVCTTILESGIDMPNANTIIVENAERLGLSQLYQIRGRVGRSNRQAYAYITYKRNKLLSEVADKRLKAIKEFTEFGSGFKIAMRDLEIRGAGSMLGEVQHGHMEQVGYDTYCKLLDEVMKETQGIQVQEEKDIQIDLNISSYIPDNFIKDSSQKIEIYQNIALCRTEEDIQNVIDEIIDRYGKMPDELENLIEIVRIKELARKSSITKIAQRMENIVFYFEDNNYPENMINMLIQRYGIRIKFSTGIEPYITLKNAKNVVDDVKEFLRAVYECKKEETDNINK